MKGEAGQEGGRGEEGGAMRSTTETRLPSENRFGREMKGSESDRSGGWGVKEDGWRYGVAITCATRCFLSIATS